MRNESACCKTKENRRRRRATSVPSARCWESLEYASDLCCTRLMASSLMRACTSEPTCVCVCVCVCNHPIYSGHQTTCGRTSRGRIGRSHRISPPSVVLALTFNARRSQPSLSLVDREVEFCVHTNLSLSAFWEDCTEIRTYIPTSEGFGVPTELPGGPAPSYVVVPVTTIDFIISKIKSL